MKPAPFDYVRVATTSEALAEMAEQPESKAVAGGQSLGAMMNLRIARPGRLMDISRVAELRTRQSGRCGLIIGACVTHAEIEDGAGGDVTSGFLPFVAGQIAYRAVRNRGTIGGSLAHADPAADWITALTALAAGVIVAGPAQERKHSRWRFKRRSLADGEGDKRRLEMTSFIRAPYTTALAPGELLVGIEIPGCSSESRWGYEKFCRKIGELAEASCAVVIDPQRRFARVVVGAVSGTPVLLDEAAGKLAATAKALEFDDILAEVDRKLAKADAVKRRQAAVCVERAIAGALRA